MNRWNVYVNELGGIVCFKLFEETPSQFNSILKGPDVPSKRNCPLLRLHMLL